MSCFICEKCGLIDNTDCNNNYWLAIGRKDIDERIIEKNPRFLPEYRYFENHVTCATCCEGVTYADKSGRYSKGFLDIENPEHWSMYSKEKILKDKNIVNANEVFERWSEDDILDQLKIFVERSCKSTLFDFSKNEEVERYIELNKFDAKIADFVIKNFK